MAGTEFETVLANWIRQELDPLGQLPQGTNASAWVAARFGEWWRGRAEEALSDAESAASSTCQYRQRISLPDSKAA
jgi:hypothetical protein